MRERPFYDPMSLRNSVDDMYSGADIQKELRAQRAIIRERVVLPATRAIKVQTVMNKLVAELFGTRSDSGYSMSFDERIDLSHYTATENPFSVIEDS